MSFSVAVLWRDFHSVKAALRGEGQDTRMLICPLSYWVRVLDDGQYFGATNELDRIYALIGLADPENPVWSTIGGTDIRNFESISSFKITYRSFCAGDFTRP